ITDSAVVTVDPTNVSGGSGTYVRVEFVYDNGTAATGDDITQDGTSFSFTTSNVLGGNVSVTVYDDQGCSATTNAVIPAFNALSLSATPITVTKAIDCRALPAGGEEIRVSVDLTSALVLGEDLIFTITGSSVSTTNTVSGPSAGTTVTSDFTGLATDIYSITIENSITGCIVTVPHQVDVVPSFALDISRDSNVVCFGDTNGSLTFDFATSSPYAGDYNYQVFNTNGTVGTGDDFAVSGPTTVAAAAGARPITVNTLGAGTYYVSVTMTDSPFCPVVSSEVTIESPTAALDFSTVDVNPSCNGNSDGRITVTAVDGWGSYTYELADASGTTVLVSYGTNNVFSGLADGTYTVNVQDANGCIDSDTVTLTEPAAVTFTLDKDDNACDLTGGGSITVTALGGSGSYTYILLDSGGTEIRNQTTNVFTNLPAGSYTVQVSDSNSCPGTSPSPTITLEPNLEFSLSITKLLDCTASPDATIELSISSGSGNYEYEVLDSGSGTIVSRTGTGGTTVSFSVSSADTYTVNVYDIDVLPAPGCSRTRTITIDPVIVPDFSAVAIDNANCDGSSEGIIEMTAVD
ncbi:SprB repeat-containing protein, partial [Tenacibaculum agarivorans]|uniref:SprB repeat-containing protein n=1 Tax=Tenacibaculum agarivorans TaxID=1908389 RepID=UPI000AD5820D